MSSPGGAPAGTWCVIGGAGYIGAHVVAALCAHGTPVTVIDDLSTGVARRLPPEVTCHRMSVLDTAAVAEVLAREAVTGVIHLAAKKAVGESVAQPVRYYAENVGGVISLLTAMATAGVPHIVYSSSAAVYGTSCASHIEESAEPRPESPYGQTKLIGEWLLAAAAQPADLRWVALRYFNVAGAASAELGDTSVNNLIPLTFRNLTSGRRPELFGDDYPTPDGSCVRDYIHVADLATAHVLAAAALESGGVTAEILNVGTGRGSSVIEVFDVVARVLGRTDGYATLPRRPGDPPSLVASVERIGERLGWRAQLDLADMVASAWTAWCHRADPGGGL
ncbi:MAG: UDP-glucose 4-epimerase GalE [Actinomycetales bacterium]|nr:UDP-glucose 4-epimerase GalE [Actinomycetales bacterium]